MPVCPNCGSIVPEGSSTCPCGTPLNINFPPHVDRKQLYYEFVEELKNENARKFEKHGDKLQRQGRYMAAIDEYITAGDLRGYYLGLDKKIGDCYYKSHKYEKALEAYNRVHNLSEVLLVKGNTLLELHRFDDAIQHYRDAIDEISTSSRFNITKNEKKLNDPEYVKFFNEESQKLTEKRNCRLALAYNQIGWAHYLKGEYDRAIKAYEDSISYDYGWPLNWYMKARSLEKKRKYVEALKFFDIAVEMDPDDEEVRISRNACLVKYASEYRNGTYKKSCEHLEEALELNERGFKSYDEYSVLELDNSEVEKPKRIL